MAAAADVLLWRNKKISSSVLGVATLVWVFFEWLDYHFLTILCFLLALGMAVQFAWATFAAVLSKGYVSIRLGHTTFAVQYVLLNAIHSTLSIPPGPLPACLACSCRRSCSRTPARPPAPR